MQKVPINTEFITLGQLLKIVDIVDSGGAAKYYLAEHPNDFLVNDENDARRGRKLRIGDVIKVANHGEFVIDGN
ncbi:MAG: S4 domain-containing protein YaaA [Lactobacillaceae bacterium]|jgi:S4 domain protein YaaA|nr:S4 domain-containing protein YaaA [Lactobacillaceae bacterium]